MKVEQYSIEDLNQETELQKVLKKPDLVLVFAAPALAADRLLHEKLTQAYSGTHMAGCSTAGEINNDAIQDDSVVITEVSFESARAVSCSVSVSGIKDSFSAGQRLAESIDPEGLSAVMVFGPGGNVNGSGIIDGMASVLGSDIPLSGGLAGDGSDFVTTYTITQEGCFTDQICALAFYGEGLEFNYGSFGGWECFGPLRKVTRSDGNILFELDGKPALELYKTYLGDYAAELPSSALLFPLEMVSSNETESGIIRTILGIDEEAGSLILAGDIDPEGYLRLMHTSVDGLIDGAEEAASMIGGSPKQRLALLVSCVGRKLVMGDEVAEEVEAVNQILGDATVATGFYSYGEICPEQGLTKCNLHNQTMTITVVSES